MNSSKIIFIKDPPDRKLFQFFKNIFQGPQVLWQKKKIWFAFQNWFPKTKGSLPKMLDFVRILFQGPPNRELWNLEAFFCGPSA